MTNVIIGGRTVRLRESDKIGGGGEADIYALRGGQALKLSKLPDDPLYAGDPDAQAGATLRLRELGSRLRAFPTNLPSEVVAPIDLAFDTSGGQVVGYTMPFIDGLEVLLMYADRDFREQGGIDANQAVDAMIRLHPTVSGLHRVDVVIGDFNDLNVLVGPDEHHLVDADSMQYENFLCRTFTSRFVDPLLCAPDRLQLARSHGRDSDWYAFLIMLVQVQLYVGPYGGVHRPKAGKGLLHDARVLRRITFFDPDVKYPKPAVPYGLLPDAFLEYLHQVFEKDRRGEVPLELLRALRWTTCINCGLAHARPRCPGCAAPGAVKEVTRVRGTVMATRVFTTHGRILRAAFQDGRLRVLYHEGGAFRREGDRMVVEGRLDPQLRFRISGDTTLLGSRGRLIEFTPGQPAAREETDQAGTLPVFDANHHTWYWALNGRLLRHSHTGSEYVGDVLAGRTLFWSGPRFGLGFYRASRLTRTFTFNSESPGINDQLPSPDFSGHLIDASCVFSDTLAWLMLTQEENGRLTNRCYVYNSRGNLVVEGMAHQDEDHWLAGSIRGHFAAANSLFVATDEGIIRITVDQGSIDVSQTFPDTEPFVTDTSELLPGAGGIYVVSANEITLIKIQ